MPLLLPPDDAGTRVGTLRTLLADPPAGPSQAPLLHACGCCSWLPTPTTGVGGAQRVAIDARPVPRTPPSRRPMSGKEICRTGSGPTGALRLVDAHEQRGYDRAAERIKSGA